MRNRAFNSNKVIAGLDGLCALALAVSAVYGNIARIPAGSVRQFLEMRVTLLNVMFAAMFVLAWTACFGAFDLYRPEHQNLFRRLKHATKGCATMTVLLGLYLFISRTTGPTVRIAAVFFITSMVFEAFRLVGGGLLRVWITARNPRLVVIMGSGRKAGIAWRQIRTRYHSTVKLLGFVDDRAVSEMPPTSPTVILERLITSAIYCCAVVDELLTLPTRAATTVSGTAIAVGRG
jgi:FlaA1/EpsC-like NDP-sugar epimerase